MSINKREGFWNNYGAISYEDNNWRWHCAPVLDGAMKGACDGGNGAPKK